MQQALLHMSSTPSVDCMCTARPRFVCAVNVSRYAQLVNLVALLAAWVTVFDTIAKEREMLERPEQDVYGTMEQGAAQGIPVRNGIAANF